MRKTICNMCGKEFDLFDKQDGQMIYSAKIGYGSKYDGSGLSMDLCIDCVDKLIDACKISPIIDPESEWMPF